MERTFTLEDNPLSFKQLSHSNHDGVELSQEEQLYLLPHFLMLLIGKPGSGKTTLLRQLLTNPQMYHKKFDEILMVSPSYAKMDLNIPPQNAVSRFSLDWIFGKIDEINQDQEEKIYGHSYGGMKLANDKRSATGNKQQTNTALMGDQRSRFYMADHLRKMNLTDKAAISQSKSLLGFVQPKKEDTQQKQYYDDPELQYQLMQQQMYKDVEQLSAQERKDSHVNVLLVLDDVVNGIKKAEYDQRLASLVMNRRHLILNGTLSIIIVSQKYTLIPVRLRSNASWLILYQLNPIDFENVYKDAIVHDMKTWSTLLKFVFGAGYDGDEQQETQKKTFKDFLQSKKFENLGIWVEFNVYFKNFKRINI